MSVQQRFDGDRRPPGRARRISVDASVFELSRAERWACIAGVLEARDARLLFLDVLRARGSVDAETLAMQKAMAIAARAHWPQVEFRTDAASAVRVPATVHAGELAEWPTFKWTTVRIPRTQNVAAHTFAKEGLRLWQAGRELRGTM